MARLLLDELVRRGASASIFLNFDLSQRPEMLALRSLLPDLRLLPMWDTATLPIVLHAEPQGRSKNLAGHEPLVALREELKLASAASGHAARAGST